MVVLFGGMEAVYTLRCLKAINLYTYYVFKLRLVKTDRIGKYLYNNLIVKKRDEYYSVMLDRVFRDMTYLCVRSGLKFIYLCVTTD